MAKNTVVINGRLYDASTGLPVVEAQKVEKKPEITIAPAPRPDFVSGMGDIVAKNSAKRQESVASIPVPRSQPIHIAAKKPNRSQTLSRQFVQKPAAKIVDNRARTSSPLINTSPMVTKFAKKPVVAPVAKRAPEPVQHDLAVRVERQRAAKRDEIVQKPANSRELKEALIREQMDKPHTKAKTPKTKRRFVIMSIASAAFTLVLIGGYFTYVNMPSLSVRVAASRAGVNAKYPEYNPSGYRIDGPVAFSPGQVTINYRSNTNDQRYSISQQNSNWDSSAVLENKVQPESDKYQTLSQKGLTVYKYDNKASWVNGGVLYTIDGDASLSTDQVLKIVDSI